MRSSNSEFVEGGARTDGLRKELAATEAAWKVKEAELQKLPKDCGKNCKSVAEREAGIRGRDTFISQSAPFTSKINDLKAKLQASVNEDTNPEKVVCPEKCSEGCAIFVDPTTDVLKMKCK